MRMSAFLWQCCCTPAVLASRRPARRSAYHSTDEQQLAYAASQQRALLTHNRADFEALHHTYTAAGSHHSGILIATRHQPHEIIRRVLIILDQVTADEMDNQSRYL